MYPHNHFSCKSATCLSPAAKSCSVLSQIGSCLNQVELLLFHLGKEVTFSHCRTGIDLQTLEVGSSATSTCIRLFKVKPVTRIQIPSLRKTKQNKKQTNKKPHKTKQKNNPQKTKKNNPRTATCKNNSRRRFGRIKMDQVKREEQCMYSLFLQVNNNFTI